MKFRPSYLSGIGQLIFSIYFIGILTNTITDQFKLIGIIGGILWFIGTLLFILGVRGGRE